jgi:ATP-dependent helicase HrpB
MTDTRMETRLPVEAVLDELRDALAESTSVVLQAPPGAGKTTVVPLRLMNEPWLEGRRIVMLEPRRLAARMAAERMARVSGEKVGRSVGYRIRNEVRVSGATRIEVVTEGILTRMLQSDPSLEGVGLLIFDEFHERSLHADLGLALALQAREVFRPDLRILVMSATLAADAVAGLLGDARVVTSEGRSYPVETYYLDSPVTGRIEPVMASTIRRRLNEQRGDILAFLPGAGEIGRTAEMLRESVPEGVDVLPLHASIPASQQDMAVAPSVAGRRKVVLSTSIAETSLTIEGIMTVVDGGLMRIPGYAPETGMTRLRTVPVSKAAADQRRGRAGRLGPGHCYRLWTHFADQHLAEHTPPEIIDADLAPVVLELAAWGVHDPSELRWLDAPPAEAISEARGLLQSLDALDDRGRITEVGQRMLTLGLHPRLAHMLIEGERMGHAGLACDVAALLQERDVLDARSAADADLRLRLDAMAGAAGIPVHRAALERCRSEAARLRQRLGAGRESSDVATAGVVVALAYPDRLGRSAGGGVYQLANGRRARLGATQPLESAPFLAVAELGGGGRVPTIFQAAPVNEDDLRRLFGDRIEIQDQVAWDADRQTVIARRVERLGGMILKEGPLADPPADLVHEALLHALKTEGLRLLRPDDAFDRARNRILFMRGLEGDPWPDVTEERLLETAEEWLGPFLAGVRSGADLQRLEPGVALEAFLGRDLMRRLSDEAPSHFRVPSGSNIAIDYYDPSAPVLAVRLQEVFGLEETPRIARGRVALIVHLLSPAMRPIQVTRDLAGFWRTSYFDVRKDMRGRYPKHQWPENPLEAVPTARTVKRPK